MTLNQSEERVIRIAKKLCENVATIRYGSVTATLKIHNGRVVDVTHSTTESKREKEKNNEA